MPLSPEQLEEWEQVKPKTRPKANAGQTAEQAANTTVASFQHVCGLEGLPIPAEEDVLAEIAKLPD